MKGHVCRLKLGAWNELMLAQEDKGPACLDAQGCRRRGINSISNVNMLGSAFAIQITL